MWADRYLFLDLETTGLDPTTANILELAYIPEIGGERLDSREFFVQPIIHSEDKIHGGVPADVFCKEYNKNCSSKDALDSFAFEGGEPLFIYAKSNLTYGLPNGLSRNPEDFISDSRREFPDVVLEKFVNDIRSLPGKKRWTLAGYNVKYDYSVLMNWIERILGIEAAREVTDRFSYVQLDVYSLVLWFVKSGRLQTVNNKLSTVSAALGFADFDAHTAKADIEQTYFIAKILIEYMSHVPTESGK